MAVHIVGNVDPDQVLRAVEARFGNLQPAPIRSPDFVPYRPPRLVHEVHTRLMPLFGQMTDLDYGIWTRDAAKKKKRAK
jgi:predicted Zn-dependent peptidase